MVVVDSEVVPTRAGTPRRRLTYALALGALVVLGLVTRLDRITAPPIGSPSTLEIRSYHSLLLARSLYVDWYADAPTWQHEIAAENYEEERPIEPPVLEAVSATAYDLLGGERTWVPRLLSVLAWLGGAALLYPLARRLASEAGALVASGVYLFLPFAIEASRASQPDPLMVSLVVAGALVLVRDDERPSRGRFAAAAAVVAAASLIKPAMALFFLFPLAAALAMRQRSIVGAVRSARLWLFGVLVCLPTAAYYAYGVLWSDILSGHVGEKFVPSLLATKEFWRGWASEASEVLALATRAAKPTAAVVVIAAAAGVVLAAKRGRSHVLLALWAGYLLFGLTFTAHIHTHSYYSLALVPISALSIAPAVDAVLAVRVRGRELRRPLLALSALAAVAAFAINHHRVTVDAPGQWAEAHRYEQIGVLTDHTAGGVFLGGDFGLAVRYHGWMAGELWPLTASQGLGDVTASERFASTDPDGPAQPAIAAMDPPARFFIVTYPLELSRQPDLERLLRRDRLVADDPHYLVFAL